MRCHNLESEILAIKSGMNRLHNAALAHDESVDKALDRHQDRLGRHRADLDSLHCKIKTSEAQHEVVDQELEIVNGKLLDLDSSRCHCGDKSPALSGEGSRKIPFELEYEGSDSSYRTVEVADDSSSVDDENKENEELLPVVIHGGIEEAFG